ncbi:hypothetical protein AJ85_18995 [Alkalihalobacillus alcalophilus ATCC 27647 = CGMCC 1.3604]|uniref:Integrase catalytic domain-containing protein n=1 Tax=Alkalihalobacillus alcalophilus ATCC 27647 = CGMCC 1.3604 TaxID=1218173 RepID=A0A4S4JVM8_ALKAL|nr:hypothetical protein AJ85_18995 [Alkalihalobacillus alcalophilus ATCC 27647 = CGMCC 1.3604]
MYLVAIIDWFSRYIISWELEQSLDIEFVIAAVNQAFTKGVPAIFNS